MEKKKKNGKENKKNPKSVFVDKPFAFRGKAKQGLPSNNTYWKVSCEAGLWGVCCWEQPRWLQPQALSSLRCPVIGIVWDVLWREFIHTMAWCSPILCLSPQHWVLIPVREGTGWSISSLRHNLAWPCLYFPSSKTPTDISRSLIPEEAEFLAS